MTASPDQLREILSEANAIIIPAHLYTTRDISRTRSVDDIYADDVFLGHARTAFTALEVTSPKTADFFDGRHQETALLAKGCVRSSDSHEPASLGWRPSYAQLEELTYTELKAALELPFRLSIDPPTLPDAQIIAISVTGAFLKDLWMSFSPHCNMLIAVKGSRRGRHQCSSASDLHSGLKSPSRARTRSTSYCLTPRCRTSSVHSRTTTYGSSRR